MSTNPTITRTAFLAAFDTWLEASGRTGSPEETAWREAVALGGLPGEAPVDHFCVVLGPRLPRDMAWFAIGKSSLLNRLIYAGEALRTVKCPEHEGQWSGCHPTPCPHGCNFGIEYTGWLPADMGARREAPVPERTPYQRGNRDGLLSFAGQCDTNAEAHTTQARKWEASRHGFGPRLAEMEHVRASIWHEAGRLARGRAEALPEEPAGDASRIDAGRFEGETEGLRRAAMVPDRSGP